MITMSRDEWVLFVVAGWSSFVSPELGVVSGELRVGSWKQKVTGMKAGTKAGIKGQSGGEYKSGKKLELRCASRSVESDCVRPFRHTGGGDG
jgi:hypothetical protein